MKSRLDIHFTFANQLRFVFGKAYKPTEGEFLLNHCRSGIMLALEAMRLPVGSKVGLLVYNCHTVMNAIYQAKCSPVFIDIRDDLTIDLEDLKKKESGMKALIITHLFGIINDVRKIKDLFPNIIIIEDCAHAYGIDKTYGDFAVFSVGQGKFPSIGDGGILLVRNKQYKEIVKVFYDALSDYSWIQSASLFMRLVLKSWLNSRFFYGWLTLPLKRIRLVKPTKELIVPRKMCNGIQSVYFYERKNVELLIERKRQNMERFADSFFSTSEYDVLIGINAFMLVIKCENTKKLQCKLKKCGYDSATHFSRAIDWASEFGYMRGNCANAEHLINHLLMMSL